MSLNLSEILLSAFGKFVFQKNEQKILQNFENYINNGYSRMIITKEKLSDYKNAMNDSPTNFKEMIEKEKLKMEEILGNFDGIYESVIFNNENAIEILQECQHKLDGYSAEKKAMSKKFEIAKKVFNDVKIKVEKIQNEYKDIQNNQIQAKQKLQNLLIFFLLNIGLWLIKWVTGNNIPGMLSIVLLLCYSPPDLGIYKRWMREGATTLEYIIFTVFFAVPIWRFETFFVMIKGLWNSKTHLQNIEEQMKIINNGFLKEKEECDQLETEYKEITEICETFTQNVENEATKVNLFTQIIKVLCKFQILLKQCQNPLDKILNIFQTQNLPPPQLQNLAEQDQKRFTQKIMELLNNESNIFNNLKIGCIFLPILKR